MGSAGDAAIAKRAAAKCGCSPFTQAIRAKTTEIESHTQAANAMRTASRAAFGALVTASCVDTGRPLTSKRLLNAMGDMLPTSNRGGKRTRQSRTGADPMRSLAVWTTTAAVALFGMTANAQTTSTRAVAAAPATVDLQSAIAGYARYQNDVTDLRTAQISSNDALENALDRV